MSNLIQGERVGRQGKLRPGASAIIFDYARQSVLLTRRTDNGRWCLPGGGMDPGESADETCVREVLEETGLEVRVTRLVGIYTSPNILVEYPDGNKIQPVAFSFEAEVIGGELGLSDETTDYGYISVAELDTVDLMEHHRQRIDDALKNLPAAVFR
ncbi:MAG TPA: NUDIX domain-containing protein [Dehalococcoidia bacterium]|nr:NUDIX domain-containing protein [Dehalococcoidia bacterium]